MTIHFHLQFEDLLALQENVIHVSYTHQIKRMYFKWITTILLAIILLFVLKTSMVTIVLSLVLVFVYYLFAPKIYNQMSFMKLKKQMEANDYSHLLGSCKMIFSDSGILRVISEKETYFKWDDFEKLEENDHYLFLYQSDLQALIIPKQIDDTSFNYHQFVKQNILN